MSEMAPKTECKYLGIQEVADMLGVCYATVRDNIVPCVEHMKVGRRILMEAKSVHKYLEEQKRKAARA